MPQPTSQLAIENQGQGTYSYDCTKPDCYHCELKNRTEHIELSLERKGRKNGYSQNDIKIVTDYWGKLRLEDIGKLIFKAPSTVGQMGKKLGLGVKKRLEYNNPKLYYSVKKTLSVYK